MVNQPKASNSAQNDAAAASSSAAAPPSYTVEDQNAATGDNINLVAAFENLKLTNGPSHPRVDTCLAHLKLLFAIQSMKEDVGYTDGLFGIWDSRAGLLDNLAPPGSPGKATTINDEDAARKEERDKIFAALSLIREKRWALFVARAVDRYESWWRTLGGKPLTESDMNIASSEAYAEFPTSQAPVVGWNESTLPPLDILMVWHTHMLNPRAYLEDCILAGLRPMWHTGMPWSLVDQVIDTNFAHKVSDRAKAEWSRATGLQWDNVNGPLGKIIACPRCNVPNEIPWTTCSLPEDYRPREDDDLKSQLIGHGYGDGDLHHPCKMCGFLLRKELLSVVKFISDVKALIGPAQRPMPGTILDPTTGKPLCRPKYASGFLPHVFPNQLLKSGCDNIRSYMTGLISRGTFTDPSMKDVRAKIEAVISKASNLKQIRGTWTGLDQISKVSIRKMMSRYWDNFSIFALDLSGAVMRQGVFVDKMFKLDWLHSPSARDTMERLIVKYGRFMAIMAAEPRRIVVPTLDVDLAWHTHQLSPSEYYAYTVGRMEKFVDHDDKIPETTLSTQFEWTSKRYQELYGEVYSECTCWYCEAIRSTHISSLGSLLGMSNNKRIAESFHDSGRAAACPPTNSAHISAHNSVTPIMEDATSRAGAARERVQKHRAAVHRKRLDSAYAKVCARAAKKGTKPPEKETYYDHWGYAVPYGYPYMYAVWWMPSMYYGYPPMGVADCASGGWGGCAAGTCGGGVAAGACGGAGGCGGTGGCGGSGGGGGGGGGGDGGGGGGGGCGGGGGGGCGGGGGG